MKRIFLLIICFAICGLSAVFAVSNLPIDIPVKTLYSAPSDSSNVVYQIPIEVKLLDISEDGNWYKVKLAYRLGPICYNYVGWTNLPLYDILAERQEQKIEAAIPAAPSPK